jgi:hypothetical protein
VNAHERVMTVRQGGIPDRVPVCLHKFLPAAREAGIPLERSLADLRQQQAGAREVADGDFSQLPVFYDERVIDLLGAEAIALWATQQVRDGDLIDGEAPVSHVVTADVDHFHRVVNRATSGVDALRAIAPHRIGLPEREGVGER